MKISLWKRTFGFFCLAGSIGLVGCMGGARYRNLVDPCQFERYSSTARQEVVAGFAPQVENGHILDQTIWNYHFETGTEKLTLGGRDKIDQLIRRRPEPDPLFLIQTAHDVPPYDPQHPELTAEAIKTLNENRAKAVQDYVKAQTVGRPIPVQVAIHDPSDPAISGVGIGRALMMRNYMYMGSMMMGGMGMSGGGMGMMGGGMGMMGGGMGMMGGGMGGGMGMMGGGGMNMGGGGAGFGGGGGSGSGAGAGTGGLQSR